MYNYNKNCETDLGAVYEHKVYGEALLTNNGLHFSTDYDNRLEVSLITSGFTDMEDFKKYDS
ncbi:hypothetical protein [Vagococcus martis]